MDLHLSHYKRRLWRSRDLLVISGDFSEALVSRDLYEQQHRIQTAAGAPGVLLDRLMAAAGLAAISLAERESWGWSITLPGTGVGLFCGVEPEGMLCGRVRAAERVEALAALQRRKGDGPLLQSSFVPPSADPVEVIEAYFEQVDQVATRLAVRETGFGVLVQALPGGRFETVADLDPDGLIEAVEAAAEADELKRLDEVVLFYDCRCDELMIRKMFDSLEDERLADLWGDERELSVECPRCGREFLVQQG